MRSLTSRSPLRKYRAALNIALVFLLVAANCVYLYWRAHYTLPIGRGFLPLILGIILFVFELLGALESFVHYTAINNVRQPEMPRVSPEEFPDVDIFIATCSESADLLYKTVNGCLHIDYPDKSKVHIYLCDDGHRPEIKALAKSMGVGYFDRPDREGAKAGNLNNALAQTASPLVATFDADMIPMHGFLMKTVPYFLGENRNTGFVQTPQSFYNPDLFQANLFAEDFLPNEQDYFYKVIEVSRNKANSVIYGGSNTVISRKALDAAGGFYTGTITEDFATGILIEKNGFTCCAINETLASGIAVDNLKGLINQRVRWARGCIATGRKMHILTSRELSLAQKLNYWASIFYWYGPLKKLVFIASPILFSVFGVILLNCSLEGMLAFWLPKFIIDNIVMRRFSARIRTLHWSAVYETLLFPFMLIPTLLEALGVSLKVFKVTRKENTESRLSAGYAAPFLVLIVLSLIGAALMLRTMIVFGAAYPAVILFWLIYNTGQLFTALFFVLGEGLYRRRDTVKAEIAGILSPEVGKGIPCRTAEISDDYILLAAGQEAKEEDIARVSALSLETERYRADISVRFVRAVERGKQKYYSFAVTDLGSGKGDYFQMIHDRPLSLPSELGSFWTNFRLFGWSLRNEIQALLQAYRGRAIAIIFVVIALAAGGIAGNHFLFELQQPFGKEMRTGWNLGNSLDAWGAADKLISMPVQYETYWGNPKVSRRLLRAVRKAGFDTIRIPVTWQPHFKDGKIDRAWMRRVKEVTDYALLRGFYVILDAHHETVLDENNITVNAEYEEYFRSLWSEIAAAFTLYNSYLIFESINEPRLIGTDDEWTAGTPEARQAVNRLNKIFVETVRQSGGDNAHRLLLLPGYCTGSGTEVLEDLWLPEGDENTAAAIHFYSPRPFAVERNGVPDWSAGNSADIAEPDRIFADIERLFTSRGKRVFFTEFGAGDRGNGEARAAWTRYVMDKAAGQNIVSVWWDNGRAGVGDLGFALFDRSSGRVLSERLVKEITGKGKGGK